MTVVLDPKFSKTIFWPTTFFQHLALTSVLGFTNRNWEFQWVFEKKGLLAENVLITTWSPATVFEKTKEKNIIPLIYGTKVEASNLKKASSDPSQTKTVILSEKKIIYMFG